jgi:long-chain fatty acid transport protein
MKTSFACRPWLMLSVSAGLAALSGTASAAFFQLQENSASGVGNANAGAAASAEDASTIWYNPAGMVRLSGSQAVVAGHYINPSSKFSKTSATLSPTLGGGNISGGDGGDAGDGAFVPNFYYAQPLGERTMFGIGVNVPFGLATDYEDDWVGRYHADFSEIQSVNVNPSISYRMNDQFAVGAGLNVQRIEATLTNAVDYGSICAVVPGVQGCEAPGALDGHARLEGRDTSFGYNVGVLWQFTPTQRLGFAYRSKIEHSLKGTSDVTAPNATAATTAAAIGVADSAVRANVTLPESIALSSFHQLTPQWALMADITRTRWSRVPELRIDFTETTQADSVITLDLKDVNRYSIGATYAPGGAWSYRVGIALDESPTPNPEARTPRLPDADRLWMALGANYRMSRNATLDFALVHIDVDNMEINKQAGTAATDENFFRGTLQGSYEASVTIFSVQGSWRF